MFFVLFLVLNFLLVWRVLERFHLSVVFKNVWSGIVSKNDCCLSTMRCCGLIFGLCFGYVQELPTELASESSKSIQVRLQELQNDAAGNGRDWLRECLADTPWVDLRKLAVAAGLEARPGNQWLPVGQLRAALLEAISPTKEDGMCQGVFRFVSSFEFFVGLARS